MFFCEAGKHRTEPGAKMHMKVTKTREKTYPERDQRTSDDRLVFHDNGGRGTEIVEEVKVCIMHL